MCTISNANQTTKYTSFFTSFLPVQAFSCFCNTDAVNCVQNTCEFDDPQFLPSRCAVDIKVFNNNGSFHSVTHYCVDGFDTIACDALPYVTEAYTGINYVH